MDGDHGSATDALVKAWESLTIAKHFFESMGDVEKECESLILLSEVSLENNYSIQAVLELRICLKKRQWTLPADPRCIAETHFKLGVALTHQKDFTGAEESLKSAIAVLGTRVANLKKME